MQGRTARSCSSRTTTARAGIMNAVTRVAGAQ